MFKTDNFFLYLTLLIASSSSKYVYRDVVALFSGIVIMGTFVETHGHIMSGCIL